MPSFRIATIQTAVALIVSAVACGDPITAETAKPRPLVETIDLSSANDGTPPPTLVVTSNIETTSGFTGTGRPGLFLRVTTVGSGFPPGISAVTRVAFVLHSGGVVTPGTSIGEFPANGSVRGAYGQSCPTPYREAYAIVTYNRTTVESKHVAAAC